MNQYGQELKANGHKIKKNNALFAVIGTNMTRKLFNT